MKTLKDVKVGETVTVAKLHGEGPVKRRIMDMGITKGVEIFVRKVAPLGDPMELNVRGYELASARLACWSIVFSSSRKPLNRPPPFGDGRCWGVGMIFVFRISHLPGKRNDLFHKSPFIPSRKKLLT